MSGAAEGRLDDDRWIDSCSVRTIGDSEYHEVCSTGDVTSGRLRATGLRAGSEVKVVDSTGQEVVLQVPAEHS